MSIKSISLQEIWQARTAEVTGAEYIDRGIKARQRTIIELSAENGLAERQKADRVNDAEFLATVHCILCVVRKEVVTLRKKAQRLAAKCERKDITVASLEEAHTELAATIKELQHECIHQCAIREDGSSPDHHNHDMGYKGRHACVICGLIARDDDYDGKNSFFPDDGFRVLRRLIHDYPTYEEHKNGNLEKRLAHYQSLATVEEVQEMFLGPKRLERLKKLLAKAAKTKAAVETPTK